MTYEDLKKANELIKTTDIKGKAYAEVNQRIKAFRSVCPDGSILTEMISNDNGICVFKATVLDGQGMVFATGHAYEKEGSTYINKTSYIENCETSAIGRALGMCGFGIDSSVASYEEVANAQLQQKKKDAPAQATNDEFQSFVNDEEPPKEGITRVQSDMIIKACTDAEVAAICKSRGVIALRDLTAKQAEGIIKALQERGKISA